MSEAPVGTLSGIGPVTQGWLEEAGIGTVGDLHALGAVEVYRRLKFTMPGRVNLNALYALEAALRGCHWLHLPTEVKEALRAQAAAIEVAFRKGMATRCLRG